MQKDGMEASRIMGIKDGLQKIRRGNLVMFASMAFFGVWSLGFVWILLAEPAGQKTFSSPAEASRALIRAVQAGKEKDLPEIFGPDGKEIISSGDKVEDKKSRDAFAETIHPLVFLGKRVPAFFVFYFVAAGDDFLPIGSENFKEVLLVAGLNRADQCSARFVGR